MANMVVRTNIFSLNAHRNMKNTGLEMQRASNRLASGFRINSAADDAAGLSISENMRAQIRGLDQASRNTQDGQAMLVVTEGGMQEMTNILQRVRELLVQGSNDTNNYVQRNMIVTEISQLGVELEEMRERVEFNTIRVLEEDQGAAWFQVGANASQSITFDFSAVSAVTEAAADNVSTIVSTLESATTNFTGYDDWTDLIADIQADLDAVNKQRSNLGATINRMDFTMRSLDISSENLADAESRVRNADMAREMMRFTMTNVLSQAATAMLAQANMVPNNLLQILR